MEQPREADGFGRPQDLDAFLYPDLSKAIAEFESRLKAIDQSKKSEFVKIGMKLMSACTAGKSQSTSDEAKIVWDEYVKSSTDLLKSLTGLQREISLLTAPKEARSSAYKLEGLLEQVKQEIAGIEVDMQDKNRAMQHLINLLRVRSSNAQLSPIRVTILRGMEAEALEAWYQDYRKLSDEIMVSYQCAPDFRVIVRDDRSFLEATDTEVFNPFGERDHDLFDQFELALQEAFPELIAIVNDYIGKKSSRILQDGQTSETKIGWAGVLMTFSVRLSKEASWSAVKKLWALCYLLNQLEKANKEIKLGPGTDFPKLIEDCRKVLDALRWQLPTVNKPPRLKEFEEVDLAKRPAAVDDSPAKSKSGLTAMVLRTFSSMRIGSPVAGPRSPARGGAGASANPHSGAVTPGIL